MKILILEYFEQEPRWGKFPNVRVTLAYKKLGVITRILRHNRFTISLCLKKGLTRLLSDYDMIIIPDTIATDALNYYVAANTDRNSQRIILFYANRVGLVKNFSLELAKSLGFEVWSYSREDCEVYNLNHYDQFHDINFFLNTVTNHESPEKFDAVFVGNAKDRLTQILILQKIFRDNAIKSYFYVTNTDELPENQCKDGRGLPYDEYLNIADQSRAIVEIVSSSNAGVTFRPIEALFLRKKLITNYTGIIRESFYSPENIFIIGHDDTSKLNKFIQSEYVPVADEIISRYNSKTFFKMLTDGSITPPQNLLTYRERISIAMATYNGVKYIRTQLDSIRTQTRSPDEVIIIDDCSTDGTYEFCDNYIRDYGLIGWKVYRNDRNLGVVKNFRAALSRCTGDYIFTCDQDDEWMPDKIQVMVKTMQAYLEIRLLVSNYIPMVNDKIVKVPVKYLNRNDGALIQYKLNDTWLDTMRPGCTHCFRRELLELFKASNTDGMIHDGVFWMYAIAADSLYLLNRQLIYWKRHEGVATGMGFSAYQTINERIKRITEDEEVCNKILASSEELYISRKNQKLLRDKLIFMEKRRKMLRTRSLFRAIVFVIINFKFYPTFRNAMSDIYAMIFLR